MKFWTIVSHEGHDLTYRCTLKHKRQTLSDFQNDCHRFSLWFNGKETEVQCYGLVDVFFDDETIPNDVKCEVQKKVWELIDENENKWAAPKGAQEIADTYCEENFN
jgi:hypothetical protein